MSREALADVIMAVDDLVLADPQIGEGR